MECNFIWGFVCVLLDDVVLCIPYVGRYTMYYYLSVVHLYLGQWMIEVEEISDEIVLLIRHFFHPKYLTLQTKYEVDKNKAKTCRQLN